MMGVQSKVDVELMRNSQENVTYFIRAVARSPPPLLPYQGDSYRHRHWFRYRIGIATGVGIDIDAQM